jgi:hypothetical protein
MAMKPKENQKHSATERWLFIEKGISNAIPRPKFAAHYLIQFLHRLAKQGGQDTSDNETVDKDCRQKLVKQQEQIAALTAAVNELKVSAEAVAPKPVPKTKKTDAKTE